MHGIINYSNADLTFGPMAEGGLATGRGRPGLVNIKN
jgi:hypothetical protein